MSVHHSHLSAFVSEPRVELRSAVVPDDPLPLPEKNVDPGACEASGSWARRCPSLPEVSGARSNG
jgi:hypothetical protein